MCKKCGESWDAYLAAKAKHHRAKRDYLKQCKELCDDKEYKPTGEVIVLSDTDKIMFEHKFVESSEKEGLWFKPLMDMEDATVFIDLRNDSKRRYGLIDGKSMDKEIVNTHTKEAWKDLKVLDIANDKKQKGLGDDFD